MKTLERIRIVLCETSHPGNVGAAARAMKTMGLGRLVLVAPKVFPSDEATARASGADDLLDRAVVVSSLPEALTGVHFALGTSARLRAIPMPHHAPREGAQTLVEAAALGEVALVFGRERTGMTNPEIDCCQALVQIPADPAFSSLNLGAAIQVLCYELRLAALAASSEEPTRTGAGDAVAATEAGDELPDIRALESFFGHLEEALFDIQFLVPGQSETMLKRLRRLVHRARPTRVELHILRGILSRAQRAAGNPGPQPPRPEDEPEPGSDI